MSPSGNLRVEEGTSDAQNADQVSPHKKLDMEVLKMVHSTCNHDYSMAGLTLRWKNFWSEKMCLLWLNGEGKDWPEIIKWFEEKGFEKDQKALYSLWVRASNEVSSLTQQID